MKAEIPSYRKSGNWKTIHDGIGKGKLIGGYLVNFAFMLNGNYLRLDKNETYLLFLEDHERFNWVPAVSKYFSHIEQSGLLSQVEGILFGHYSENKSPMLDEILGRIGENYNIPIVRCDDFGHGIYNAILPIDIVATLDANSQTLAFEELLLEQ